MPSTLKKWDEAEFNHFLSEKSSGVISFGANWCSACKMIEPNISNLASKYEDLAFAKIDVAECPGLASKMGVMSLPNILIFQKGKVIDQIIGATNSRSLEDKIKNL